jgi:hypothetical protein
MVGPVGLEPTTYGLKVRSSAIELEARAHRLPAASGPPIEHRDRQRDRARVDDAFGRGPATMGE